MFRELCNNISIVLAFNQQRKILHKCFMLGYLKYVIYQLFLLKIIYDTIFNN